MLARPLVWNVRQFQNALIRYRPVAKMGTAADGNEAPKEEDDVLLSDHDRKGKIVLNRPKQLNALNHSMVKKLSATLRKWKYDKSLIIVKGGGGKAFCAGGDVVTITKDKSGKAAVDFFRDEYKLDALTASLTRPYVALLNGIVMGGGVGISINGKYRVATEKTLFAMPETAIGLFPDVGATYFLSRMPHNLGVFLSLTGHRLKGYDLYHAGIATHFCTSENMYKLEQALLDPACRAEVDEVEGILNEFHCSSVLAVSDSKGIPPPFSLIGDLTTINNCFAPDDVEEIFRRLSCETSEFAKKQLETLKAMSPLSMKITRYQVKNAAKLDIYECLNTDFRIACRILQRTEFFEGVRALLVDKDKKPKWDPPELSKISNKDVKYYFDRLPAEEELNLPSSMEKSNL